MIETVFVIVILVALIFVSMKRPPNFPPGPFPLPFIGNLHSVNHFDPQKSWESIRKKYGDISGMVVPNYTFVVVSGWTAIREALNNVHFQGRPDCCLLRDRFNGGRYGIFFTDGELWKTQRRFSLHHFRNLGFGRKSHEAVILEEAQSLVDEIASLKGTPTIIEKLVGISAINITWCLIGGKRYNRSDPALQKLVKHVKESLHSVKVIGSPAVIVPFIRYLFPELTGYKAITRASRVILKFIRMAVEDKRKNPNKEHENDFISIYLQEMNKQENSLQQSFFSLAQLEGLCWDFLAAGSDTSSCVLSFAILFLISEKGVQEKVYQEVYNVIGDRNPCYEDKALLIYTEAFLAECLRFRAPVPTYPPHQATNDSTLSGFNIPKGTVLIINPKSIYTDSDYWGDPEVFRPERFITAEGKLLKDERFITFGKGKRSCLGETLAKMSSFLIFVSLVQNFSFSFPEGGAPKTTEGSPGFTLAPPEYRVIATPRARTTTI